MKPKWETIKITLGEIQGWAGNPRMSTVAQAKRLIESEKKFGQPLPFLVNPPESGKYLLLDGHQRLAAWLTVYGAEFVVDAKVCDRPLTEDEHKELIVTLHTGATGSWDWNILSSWETSELQTWGMDAETLKEWNTDALNLKEMLLADKPQTMDAEPQIDKAEELRVKWGVESGQMWQLGEHRIICGDCTDKAVVDRLMAGEKAELAPVDPPYNVGFDYDGSTVDDNKNTKSYEEFSRAWFGLCQYVSTHQIVTPGCNNLASWLRWFDAFHWAPWTKSNSMTNGKVSRFWCWEPVLFFGEKWVRNRPNDIFDFPIGKQEGVANHPCPKPLKMWADLIENYSESGAIIFESFLGSGTTLIACENIHRKCRAIEISPAYVAVAIQRWVDLTGGTPKLIEPVIQDITG